MKRFNAKILIATISFFLFPVITLTNVSAHLLTDYSSTSAGGNLSPVTFTTTKWVSDVHFAVYSYSSGDPIAGESGYQDFSPAPISVTDPVDQTNSMTVDTEYLYVYQISHDPAAIANITAFNAAITAPALGTITSVGYTNDTDVDIFGLGSGNADDGPFAASYTTGAQSVQYSYIFNEVEAGEKSFIMFFTSTNAPTFNSVSLQGGEAANTQQLPSPGNDSDGDGIYDDGDNSSIIGDNTCSGGNTTNCDDNCLDIPNSDQLDIDGDGIGDVCDDDADGDGFFYGIDDCDDNAPTINPDACDIKHDGIDQDCDGFDRTKGKPCEGGGTSEPEICDDGIDNDGDGKTDCADKKDCRKDPDC